MAAKSQDPQPPSSLPNVNPPEVAGAGQTRLVVEAVKETVAELKVDVRNIRDHRFTDIMWHIGALATGVILLGGMMIAAYFKLEDKIEALSNASNEKFEAISNASTRVETKLDDLLQRIPPVVTTPSSPVRK